MAILKGSHLFQTIFLGIHLGFRGCRCFYDKEDMIKMTFTPRRLDISGHHDKKVAKPLAWSSVKLGCLKTNAIYFDLGWPGYNILANTNTFDNKKKLDLLLCDNGDRKKISVSNKNLFFYRSLLGRGNRWLGYSTGLTGKAHNGSSTATKKSGGALTVKKCRKRNLKWQIPHLPRKTTLW